MDRVITMTRTEPNSIKEKAWNSMNHPDNVSKDIQMKFSSQRRVKGGKKQWMRENKNKIREKWTGPIRNECKF